MSEIERLEWWASHSGGIRPNADGKLVRYSDHLADKAAARKRWEAEYKDGLEERMPDWLLEDIRAAAVKWVEREREEWRARARREKKARKKAMVRRVRQIDTERTAAVERERERLQTAEETGRKRLNDEHELRVAAETERDQARQQVLDEVRERLLAVDSLAENAVTLRERLMDWIDIFHAGSEQKEREAFRAVLQEIAILTGLGPEKPCEQRCGGSATIPCSDPHLLQAGCTLEPCPGCPDCKPEEER